MADPPSHPCRITVSLGEQDSSLIQEAADLAGETIEKFTQRAASDRARALIGEQRHIVFSGRTFRILSDDLDGPGITVPALQDLFALPRIPESAALQND